MTVRGRWGGNDIRSFQAGRNFLDVRWTSGNTGAVSSIDKNRTYGFASPAVTRSGVGTFVLHLFDVWNDIIEFDGGVQQASYSAAGACWITQPVVNLAAKTVTVTTVNSSGAATDPTNGDVLTVNLTMQLYKNV